MTGKQCMETIEKEFIIEASGKSSEEAIGSIFGKLRKQIYSEVKGSVLHMEPLEVYKVSKDKKEYIEKFLWVFMPRKKVEYKIKLKIIVLIKYIPN
ncbi:DUF4312 family protein [Sporosalibacterium faouarense]|uniref:DUF4312 family protein n=1 Tax=Sporosalibacterium faouarense TaxID=516123 RepID=UPI00141C4335|nr:DUF4312 family protein [Sporosalibacterium faouarense]MTI46277.1 DUF4312 family protein [Bacillota bacterium]